MQMDRSYGFACGVYEYLGFRVLTVFCVPAVLDGVSSGGYQGLRIVSK